MEPICMYRIMVCHAYYEEFNEKFKEKEGIITLEEDKKN